MIFKKNMFQIRFAISIVFWKMIILLHKIIYKKNRFKVIFISEKKEWAITNVAKNIVNRITKKKPEYIIISNKPQRFENKIIHFGSHYMWLLWFKYLSKNNKYIVSFYHGNPMLNESEKKVFYNFIRTVPKLEKIVVSNSIIKKRLLQHGVLENKIVQIPIGVNTNTFVPPSTKQRNLARKKFNFLDTDIVIGSFQKDGVGWKQGIEPKLIKGPDIFVKVLDKLKKDFEIKVLLTGPARGFVINKLTKLKIPFHHSFLSNYHDILEYYHALDFYLITSRDEGGPMGLMESMSIGIPVISTKVGMSEDLIKNKDIGLIIDSFEPNIIAKNFKKYINSIKNPQNRSEFSRKLVQVADWKNVSNKHLKLYESIIQSQTK